MDDVLTIEHFAPHVGKLVRVKATPFAFTLDRVEQGLSPSPTAPRMPFIVIFRGDRGTTLREGFYVCEIDGGPSYSLYVAPIHTAKPDRQEYQSSFN